MNHVSGTSLAVMWCQAVYVCFTCRSTAMAARTPSPIYPRFVGVPLSSRSGEPIMLPHISGDLSSSVICSGLLSVVVVLTVLTLCKCPTVKVDLMSECRHICVYTPECNSLSTRPSNLGTGCGWLVSFKLLPLLSRGKSPEYPLYNKRLGGPRGRFGRYGEKKNNLSVPGIELRFLGHPPHSLDTVPTEVPYVHTDAWT